MVYEQSFPDRCAGMDLDPRLARPPLGNPSCPEIMSFQIQFMCQPVSQDHPEAGIQEDFHIRFDRRITLTDHLDLFLDI